MEVGFKKRTKREVLGRKRSRPLEDVEDAFAPKQDDAADVEQVARSLQELREDQRLREQVLKDERTRHQPTESQEKKPKQAISSDISQYGLHDPKKDGFTNQKLLTLLDGQFTGQSTTTDKDQHEELMNKYIEEKLQQKRRFKTNSTDEDRPDATQTRIPAEDTLYELPEHLKPNVTSSNNSYDNGTDGGILMGNVGIAEVELPRSFLEKTEEATRKALNANNNNVGMKLDAIGGLPTSGLPANFSVDFNRHRTDYVTEMKSLSKVVALFCRLIEVLTNALFFVPDEQHELGFQQVGKHQASDDRAVSRFRKSESRKLRR
ncbi:hypothetical protein PsorP6_007263 [Peronosclerospora sorghi]|uniref:Uncharacterized protein n=1 Tax=Peronosclerospora sorghi TaxID=230839 RepID=A0ACC0WBW8_9STRA|nr:hypothetical protein PsorP6_007263 [Peronosclerospora sorghi]